MWNKAHTETWQGPTRQKNKTNGRNCDIQQQDWTGRTNRHPLKTAHKQACSATARDYVIKQVRCVCGLQITVLGHTVNSMGVARERKKMLHEQTWGRKRKLIFPLVERLDDWQVESCVCSDVMWYTLTQVRGTGGLLASSNFEETFSKRWTSLFWAKAIFLHGGAGRQGGRRTQGRLLTAFTDFFIHILGVQQQIHHKLPLPPDNNKYLAKNFNLL